MAQAARLCTLCPRGRGQLAARLRDCSLHRNEPYNKECDHYLLRTYFVQGMVSWMLFSHKQSPSSHGVSIQDQIQGNIHSSVNGHLDFSQFPASTNFKIMAYQYTGPVLSKKGMGATDTQNIMTLRASEIKKSTCWKISLHKILECADWFTVAETRSVVVQGCWGQAGDTKGHERTLGVLYFLQGCHNRASQAGWLKPEACFCPWG